VERVYVLTGDDHEKITASLSLWKSASDIKGDVECLQSQSLAQSICGLSEKVEIKIKTQILFFEPTQPMISREAFQGLTLAPGKLTPDDWPNGQLRSACPISLPWPALLATAQHFAGQPKEALYEDLLNHILEAVQLKPITCDHEDLLCVQTRRGQIMVESIARKRIVNHWIDLGVGFPDPGSAFIGPRTDLARRGVWVGPQVRLEGKTSVGEGTTVGQGSIIRNSLLGANIEIRPYCVINDTIVGDGAKVGPFAHLREGSQLSSGVHVGNFVETKKALLHSGAKANHLSYLGDCEVGQRSNIGAGCITCNYDGFNKHRTKIGKDVFIGSDCQLVAPVVVGDGAILAAGTTLTSDVPDNALVLTRPETTIKDGGANKIRTKLESGAKGRFSV
jgi:bifunctional UDP-N-acetylglucosamine pyrophosphorylase/glucosamine-1-phosphate N-acetyltransferase